MPTDPVEETATILQHLLTSSKRRSELSAERSYQNAERNLSLVVHSSAALMILGLSVDHYRSYVRHAAQPGSFAGDLRIDAAGLLMMVLGTCAALAAGLLFLPYLRAYHRNPHLSPGRSALLAPAFALLLAGCGMATLIFMWFSAA